MERLFFSRKTKVLYLLFMLFCVPYLCAQEGEVHSFDLFDTLVGRVHKEPDSVFHIIEKSYPCKGFASLRQKAEKYSNGTMDDIYKHLIKMLHISVEEGDALRTFELAMELENVFPIVENLALVEDGDIIVSDTYYSQEELTRIVEQIGLKKKVEIFASYDGKRRGYIWSQLQKKYKVLSHIGDNQHADVISPTRYEIPAKLYKGSDFSSSEKELAHANKGLSHLMRVLRLMNPFQKESLKWKIWHEQAQLNVPILVLSSLYMNDFCIKHQKNTLLFSARGCCHLFKIFKKLFPFYKSIYFQASRIAYMNPTEEYIRYVRSVYTPDAIIVDEHGRGVSCVDFFKKKLSMSPLYLSIVNDWTSNHYITHGFGDHIEMINFSYQGSLFSYNDEGPVRLPLEYDIEHIKPSYACIRRCLQLLDRYQYGEFDQEALRFLLSKLRRYTPVLQKYLIIDHPKRL